MMNLKNSFSAAAGTYSPPVTVLCAPACCSRPASHLRGVSITHPCPEDACPVLLLLCYLWLSRRWALESSSTDSSSAEPDPSPGSDQQSSNGGSHITYCAAAPRPQMAFHSSQGPVQSSKSDLNKPSIIALCSITGATYANLAIYYSTLYFVEYVSEVFRLMRLT